jgi:FkbM family methyltransferase
MSLTPLQRVTTGLLRRFGYRLLGEWRLADLPFETHLRALFEAYAIDLVLDVGANDGGFGQFIRQRVGYRGPIVSFEPLPDVFARLQAAIAHDSQWSAVNVALGDTSGTKTINVTAASVMASFLVPAVAPNRDALDVRERLTVPVMTLDEWVEQHPITGKRAYLKLDTQGYDLHVAAGAQSCLDRFYGLQSELSCRPYYDAMPNYRTAIDYFEGRGFALSNLFPIAVRDLLLIEMDGVFVNTRLTNSSWLKRATADMT